MEQKASGNQVQLNNYKIPGMRGPRNRGREVEKYLIYHTFLKL